MPLSTDREKCAHLLRRFGLGASEAEVTFYLQDGLHGAIDRLVEYDSTEEGFGIDIDEMKAGKNQRVNMPGVVNWWIMRMVMTRRPLQEKMSLFWHNHFATSASKVDAPYLMHAQNEVLRKNATGNFRQMLAEVSKDPAMILWLDNQENVKGHANENFAREVMELFTLGIGNYTEKDVQEGARAFTGWTLKRKGGRRGSAEFLEVPVRHDVGSKTFLGTTGNYNGDDVLGMLCDRPRTAEFIVRKFFNWFVYPNPSPEVVQRFASRFYDSHLDIKSLLKDVMKSTEFYSAKAERAVVKCPVDFCVSTLRQLGVGEQMRDAIKEAPNAEEFPRIALLPAAGAQQTMKSMGMWLMYPPDVHGWDIGQSWITSATMIERIAWGERIFGQGKSSRVPMRYPAFGLFSQDPTSRGVVKKLISVFDAPIQPDRYALLESAATKASGGDLNENNANATAAAVSRLIFATPEFQFA